MAITYVGKGAFASGTGILTVAVPTGYADNDIFLLMVESANQTINTPSGWTQVTNSPQFTGTAAVAGGVRLAVFWKLVSGVQSSQSVADSGDHTTAIMSCWRGVHSTTPFNITAGKVDSTATTSLSCPTVTTTVDNCMIVNAIGLDKDLADVDTLSAWANASLVSITERHDQTVTSGAGGGIAFASGIKTLAGLINATTATGDTSTTHAYLTMALTPAPGPEPHSGSSSISQSSTVEVVGNTQKFGSCEISQASAIVVTGEKYENPGVFGSVEITQSSTVQATGFKRVSGSSAIAQSSTIEAVAKSNKFGQSSISNNSTVQGIGKKSISDRVEISQGSMVQSLSFKSVSVQASISQGSTVYAIGTSIVPPEEHFGSCSISQDSVVETSSYKSGKGSPSVVQASSVVVTGAKGTSFAGLVSQVYTIVGLGYKTANGRASISQGSIVKASKNVKLNKKYCTTVKADGPQQMTVQPSNYAATVQINKKTEGDITMSSPHREEIKL